MLTLARPHCRTKISLKQVRNINVRDVHVDVHIWKQRPGSPLHFPPDCPDSHIAAMHVKPFSEQSYTKRQANHTQQGSLPARQCRTRPHSMLQYFVLLYILSWAHCPVAISVWVSIPVADVRYFQCS